MNEKVTRENVKIRRELQVREEFKKEREKYSMREEQRETINKRFEELEKKIEENVSTNKIEKLELRIKKVEERAQRRGLGLKKKTENIQDQMKVVRNILERKERKKRKKIYYNKKDASNKRKE